MDKKNKLADYAAKIAAFEKNARKDPVTREEKLATKDCLESEKKFFLEKGTLYRALIPHLYVRKQKILYGVEPVNHVEIESSRYQDDGALDTLRKIISVVRNDTFRRSAAVTSIYFSADMEKTFTGNILKLYVDGDNIEPSATNKAWGRYHAEYDMKNYSVKGEFDIGDDFFDAVPADIVNIISKSEEENDELTSGIKTLLSAKNAGIDLTKGNKGPTDMTRTELIQKLGNKGNK